MRKIREWKRRPLTRKIMICKMSLAWNLWCWSASHPWEFSSHSKSLDQNHQAHSLSTTLFNEKKLIHLSSPHSELSLYAWMKMKIQRGMGSTTYYWQNHHFEQHTSAKMFPCWLSVTKACKGCQREGNVLQQGRLAGQLLPFRAHHFPSYYYSSACCGWHYA